VSKNVCGECGRRKTATAVDSRWYVFMTAGGGLHVDDWTPELAEIAEMQACGDYCGSIVLSRWLALRKLEKGRAYKDLSSYLPHRVPKPTPGVLYCLGANCDFEFADSPVASAVVRCPKCGGTSFGTERPVRTCSSKPGGIGE
jgi:hypothetical protein